MDIVQRALDIVTERIDAYMNHQESLDLANLPKQAEISDDYKNMFYSNDFNTAYQEFTAKYGEEEFFKQAQLALDRASKRGK